MIWVTLTALPPNRALFATAAASMRIPVAAGTVASEKDATLYNFGDEAIRDSLGG